MNQYKFLGIALTAFAFSLTLAISLTYTTPIGADVHFHLEIARIWARGENGMTSSFVMEANRFPYPPLFHFLLVPSVWLKAEFLYARALQVFFYPLGLATSMWVMWRHNSKRSAVLCGILLMSSIAFFDRLFQAIPQALDMILFPLAMHTFLTDKKLAFIMVCSAMIYNHGFAAILLLGGLLVYSVKQQRTEPFWTGITTLPVTVPALIFATSGWAFWGQSVNTAQERAFLTNPLLYSLWQLGPLFIGIFLTGYLALHWKTLDKFDKASMLTVASLLPMIVPWPDRFLTYVTIPLSFLMARRIAKRKELTVAILPLLIFCCTIPWIWLLTGSYHTL